jgi:hypothetical protein
MTVRVGTIPLDVIGRVVNSDPPDMHVRVEHDADSTGGYFVFWWPAGDDPDGPCTFDDWHETAEDLQRYFQQSGLQIAWRDT